MMTERRVVDWISYDDGQELVAKGSKEIGINYRGGGWFGFDSATGLKCADRWSDYVEFIPEEMQPYAEALRREIVANEVLISGSLHQMTQNGAPLFDDGSVGLFGCRAWGDLQAAIWSEELDRNYNYMNFYCDLESGSILLEADCPPTGSIEKRKRPPTMTSGEQFFQVVRQDAGLED